MDKFLHRVLFAVAYFILYVEQSHIVLGNVSRIVGGHDAPARFGRFHASLRNLTGHHVCGGAVVSKWHVVTAAHCVFGANPQYIKVFIGTTRLDRGGKRCNVSAIHINDNYNRSTRSNDIAVVTIKGTFDCCYTAGIKMHEYELVEGDPVTITGFGALEPKGDSSPQLRALNVTVFSQATCVYAMRYSREVTSNMFCTFTKIGEGTCHGDSGSPVTKDNKLVGVVSWGIPCARGFPDVHTRIKPFIGWIKKLIRDHYCGLKSNYKEVVTTGKRIN
ncbi:hypothetical protein O3G_MSEX001788 [Manduca sexta]|uniref:Peptidase S1 domain-containing protein n=1 Tax=Manduca sexta TaxID=7130 RepID=A0A921YL77_MANSE|nr:hypothetical protein O3G_MSEX001788 [Manduca sexta]KAG6441223.1 hypothetical protein O3G_MSEX001788 [Manduca sexta]